MSNQPDKLTILNFQIDVIQSLHFVCGLLAVHIIDFI